MRERNPEKFPTLDSYELDVAFEEQLPHPIEVVWRRSLTGRHLYLVDGD